MLALCFVRGMCFSKEATFSIFVGKRGERERKVPESRLQIAAAFFSYLYLYLFRDTFVQVKKTIRVGFGRRLLLESFWVSTFFWCLAFLFTPVLFCWISLDLVSRRT